MNNTKNERRQLHLVPNKHLNRWVVKIEGGDDGRTFRTKKAAGRYMIQVSRFMNVQRVIHGVDGRFQSKKSY